MLQPFISVSNLGFWFFVVVFVYFGFPCFILILLWFPMYGIFVLGFFLFNIVFNFVFTLADFALLLKLSKNEF